MAACPEFRGNVHRTTDELKIWTAQRREAALEPDLPIVDPHHSRAPQIDPRMDCCY